MAFQIIWSNEALETYQALSVYLQSKWSLKTAITFDLKSEAKLDLISQSPFLGIASTQNRAIRKILITKQNYLYYQIQEEKIYLLSLVDTRQNPKTNKFES